MIGLFFEVLPKDGLADEYFERAAALRPELGKNKGLRFIDRYRSLERPGVILSHQLWEDEASLIAWREHPGHRATQRLGRDRIFADYRIRVATMVAEWQRGDAVVPMDSVAGRPMLTVSHDGPLALDVLGEGFASVYRDGEFISVADDASGWNGEALSVQSEPASSAVRLFSVVRDYTMRERTEAPQNYPPVP